MSRLPRRESFPSSFSLSLSLHCSVEYAATAGEWKTKECASGTRFYILLLCIYGGAVNDAAFYLNYILRILFGCWYAIVYKYKGMNIFLRKFDKYTTLYNIVVKNHVSRQLSILWTLFVRPLHQIFEDLRIRPRFQNWTLGHKKSFHRHNIKLTHRYKTLCMCAVYETRVYIRPASFVIPLARSGTRIFIDSPSLSFSRDFEATLAREIAEKKVAALREREREKGEKEGKRRIADIWHERRGVL